MHHNRFPTGPLKDIPWIKRVADAHKEHHKLPHMGAPYGLFLGPEELEAEKAKLQIAGTPLWLKACLVCTASAMVVGIVAGF